MSISSAVLDANVLSPSPCATPCCGSPSSSSYTPLWSARILDEMTRKRVEHQITAAQTARIEAAMRAAFEEAEVDAAEIERLEPAMTDDEKDRHVLAAPTAVEAPKSAGARRERLQRRRAPARILVAKGA